MPTVAQNLQEIKKSIPDYNGRIIAVTKYVDDMTQTLNSIADTMLPNGVMGLMIGDTIIKGEYVKATNNLEPNFILTFTD